MPIRTVIRQIGSRLRLYKRSIVDHTQMLGHVIMECIKQGDPAADAFAIMRGLDLRTVAHARRCVEHYRKNARLSGYLRIIRAAGYNRFARDYRLINPAISDEALERKFKRNLVRLMRSAGNNLQLQNLRVIAEHA